MIPLWMFPLAVACGNGFVLKPSEQDPSPPCAWPSCLPKRGPRGILSVVHGGADQVDALLSHLDVKAVSFVGSARVGGHVYRSATSQLKRAQCFCRRQEPHGDHAGCQQGAGARQPGGEPGRRRRSALHGHQRGGVRGERQGWIPELAAEFIKGETRRLARPRGGLWPLISPEAKVRVEGLIEAGIAEGAECLLDGRFCDVPGYPVGNWVGPTLFRGVTPRCASTGGDLPGPCWPASRWRAWMRRLPHQRQPYGNGTSLFTGCGAAAAISPRGGGGPGGDQRAHPGAAAVLLLYRLARLLLRDLHAYGKQAVRFTPRPRR